MYIKKYTKKQKGFTLIELLVVIGIIGLLASGVLASVNNAREKARDASRKAGLCQISLALNFYYDDHGSYPLSNGDGSTWDFSTEFSTEWIDGLGDYFSYNTNQDDGLIKYANARDPIPPASDKIIPKDPVNNSSQPWIDGNYSYAYYCSDGDNYDLITQLENTEDPDICANMCWKRYTGGGGVVPWCSSCPGGEANSDYIYAEH